MAFTCPNCRATLPGKSWLKVLFEDGDRDEPLDRIESFAEDWGLSQPGEIPIHRWISGSWMRCLECNYVLVRLRQVRRKPERDEFPAKWPILSDETWVVLPRLASRPVAKEVEAAMPTHADYYRQASAILEVSPIASAVLSRRILADVLAKYAGRNEFALETQIDKFIEDTSVPSSLRANLHHLREMGNFGAHTQEDDQAIIIDVEREEAEWTLDVLDRMFDFFIVGPSRDAEMRARMDQKIAEAGRKAIKPLSTGAQDDS